MKAVFHVELKGGSFTVPELVRALNAFAEEAYSKGATSTRVYIHHDTDPSGTEIREGLHMYAYDQKD
jgi:hypothetical protein